MACLEQRIAIPSKAYHELIILATAEFEDFMTMIKVLTIDKQEFDLAFECICWVKPEIDIVKTQHYSFSRARKHPDDLIEVCEDNGYIYKYCLPIPTNAELTTIILPLCPNIHIFAMNLVTNGTHK